MSGILRRLNVVSSSQLCAGDWVQVKSREEILATLDRGATLDGMPFMPEMFKYCGQQYRIYKRAFKTCDYSKGMEARRVLSAVHLEGLRCTGEAHGGCQAECLLFWKEAWLTKIVPPAGEPHPASLETSTATGSPQPNRPRCTEGDVRGATRASAAADAAYVCQATSIPRFSTPLATGELDQYLEAMSSGNVRLRDMPPPLLFRVYARLVYSRLGGTEIPQRVYDFFQKLRGGIPFPNRPGKVPAGAKTPVGTHLNLQPGEYVRVKRFDEILQTIDREGRNRGLLFSQEMVPFCGKVARVHSRVNRIIDERNGTMLHFKNDCIILQNVVCEGRYNAGLSFCPRANYPYWREIWLERAETSAERSTK